MRSIITQCPRGRISHNISAYQIEISHQGQVYPNRSSPYRFFQCLPYGSVFQSQPSWTNAVSSLDVNVTYSSGCAPVVARSLVLPRSRCCSSSEECSLDRDDLDLPRTVGDCGLVASELLSADGSGGEDFPRENRRVVETARLDDDEDCICLVFLNGKKKSVCNKQLKHAIQCR